MGEGLDVGLDEFKTLKVKDQNIVIFQNISDIRISCRNDKINKRIQYVWLIALSGLLGFKRIFGL